MEIQGIGEKRFVKWGLELLPYLLLTALTLLLLFLPIPQGAMFGSEGDWYSQHVGAAEALRQTILSQGTIFPQFVGIGGGINAYDLAYYGLLRPDLLIACLLPNTAMKYIISAYAVAGAVAAVNLTYAWLKGKKLSTGFSLCGGLLLAAATCLFHAHHQIMFINYMPFLILALMGIDRLLAKGKSLLLAVSVFFICMHSFYYAPACLAACLIYGLWQLWQRTETKKTKAMLGAKAALAVLLGIAMAAVLLLPTGLDILSTAKDGGSFLDEPMPVVNLTFESLLYHPYGCGMTLGALYFLLLSLTSKRKRPLAAVLLLIFLVPAIWFALSGFLYPRAKILIPFVPLVVLLCADTMEEVYEKKQKPYLLPAVLCLIPALLSGESRWQGLMLLDCVVVIAFAAAANFQGLPQKVRQCAFAVMLSIPLCVSFGINTQLEDYLAADDVRQSRFSFGDITMFAEDTGYRFDYLANNYINSNVLPDGSLHKTASYTSVTNSLYGDFYYNTMRNPISLRNRVVLMPNHNNFFNYFMGIRYVLTEEDRVPYGYRTVFRRNGYVLAENPDVLPICYGTDRIRHQKNTVFPQNLTDLCGVSVKEEKPETVFAQDFPTSYDKTEKGKHTLPLREVIRDKSLILTFDLNRHDGRETAVSINGMKNLLSGKSAPYPNENYNFSFVLSEEAGMRELELNFSKGNYDIENLRVFTADMPSVDENHVWPATAETAQEPDQENQINHVFSGTVNMKADGYFVTSYPFKKGYEITADGKPVEPQLVNTAFTGFPLAKGEHKIVIDYKAPGFEAGAIISLLGIAGLTLLGALEYLRERKREL